MKIDYCITKGELAKDAVNNILGYIKSGATEIELKARGRWISRAVDVLEILKRRVEGITAKIITTTEEMQPDNQLGKLNYQKKSEKVRVSTIIIKVKKGDLDE